MARSSSAVAEASAAAEAKARAASAAIAEAAAGLESALPRAGEAESAASALVSAGERLGRTIDGIGRDAGALLDALSERQTEVGEEHSAIAGRMNARMEEVAGRLEEARARMAAFLTTEQAAIAAAERTGAVLDQQSSRAEATVETIVGRTAEAAESLSGQLDAVGQAEAAAMSLAAEFAAAVERETERLRSARSGAADDLSAMAEATEAAYGGIEARAAAFTREFGRLTAEAAGLQANLDESAARIEDETARAARAEKEIVQIAESSSKALARHSQVFVDSVTEAEAASATARRSLKEQARAIASAAQAATMQSGLAAGAFEEQAERLERSAERAESTARRLAETARSQTDRRFLQSASFVAEGLNSLALDLHRILDRDAPESLWKAYCRGDRSLFARRLVDRASRRDIRAAYRDDGEFRRHVDLYVNEFESLMLAVEETERESILYGVFLSADIGKLYMVLCDALERTPTAGRRKQGT
jgi:hypothetical protein